ncbi:MAG: hypothetical protein HOP27_09395 [Anaerolineales bacterium]|nr:hypothetical protein [Anaerolineales bacterium]
MAIAMKRYLSKFLATTILSTVLLSCGKVEPIQTPPIVLKQSTPTISIVPTVSPTAESLPTITPYPTTLADATAQAFDFVLCNNNAISWWDISPNGKWLAAPCIDENDTEESPLFISSMDNSQHWKIYYSDYIFSPYIEKIGLSLDQHDDVIPTYWSKDGRYLFATVGSRLDGCCWITGSRHVLLVRLNLETGEQAALLRTDYYSANVFSFIISDSDRYLLFTPPSYNLPYDFAVLDFQTWETQEIFLKVTGEAHMDYAKLSPKEDKVILLLFEYIPYDDYYLDSIVLIDLVSGRQDLLISDIKPEEELFPIQWIDNNHVLMSNINPVYYAGDKIERRWTLDINSGQLEERTP